MMYGMNDIKTSIAAQAAGSQSELARLLGVTRQSVNSYIDKPMPELWAYRLRDRAPEVFARVAPRELAGQQAAE